MSPGRPLWRRWLLPAFFALAGANLAAFLAWTLPRGLRERNAAARVESARASLRAERESLEALRGRASAIRSNEADLERFYERYAGTEARDLVPTLEEVETMARTPGLRLAGRSYGYEEVKGARLARLAITLPLAGSYEQLVGFLREVERSPRFLTVDEISMRSDRGSAKLEVQVSGYMKPAGDLVRRGTRGR